MARVTIAPPARSRSSSWSRPRRLTDRYRGEPRRRGLVQLTREAARGGTWRADPEVRAGVGRACPRDRGDGEYRAC